MKLATFISHRFFRSGLFPKLDRILGYHFEKKSFKERTGYRLNIKNPTTFNSKVVYKKLFDRNPLLHQTADKQNIKVLLKEKFGQQFAKRHLIPTLYSGNDPENIPFHSLPPEYIIKGCHLSGYNLIITKDSKFSNEQIIGHCKFLLKLDISKYTHEWLYGKIPKNVILEPLIRDDEGNIPKDYKFFCFNGKVKMFQVDYDRFTSMKRSLFDQNGKHIEGTIRYPKGGGTHGIRNLAEIIAFVESITFGLDFVRVDIYIVNHKPIFGELTHYPGAGKSKIMPVDLDVKLATFWS